MHLKALEVAGFKSFAKKTDLGFSTAITGIVGPNGSGKSNVAEAFRFVLGEQSIKSLRGKRGEDLIFNGSQNQSRANRASVKIVLDNTKRTFPVDFEEVTIERVVNRDGENEYLINGTRMRLKDIQELLASANIGPTGHHIISQGEADRILTAGARERREMIEDALGLKVFQYKKVESERKLKKTKENIEHVESLRREVAPHLRFLERQMKKMEKAFELRNELTAFYAEYLRREDEYLAFHQDRLALGKKQPLSEKSTLEERLRVAKERLAAVSQDEKGAELVSLEERIRTAREERQEILRSIGKVEGSIAYIERTIAMLTKAGEQAQDVSVSLADVERTLATIEEEARRAEGASDIGDVKSIVSNIVASLSSFVSTARNSGKGNTDTQLSEHKKELATLVGEKERSEGELGKVSASEDGLRAEYDALKKAIDADQSDSRHAEREVFEVMGKQREVEQQIIDIEREERSIERSREEFKRELSEAVILVGRAAADYFNVEVKDAGGIVLTREHMVAEERTTQEERRRTLEKMKIRLEELGGAGGEDVAKEYKDAKERDEFLEKEIADLNASIASLTQLILELTEQLNVQFNEGITKISTEFGKFFGMMFNGGTASLLRVEPKVKKSKESDDLEMTEHVEEELAEEGIEIDVKLPQKRIKGLEMLSGGERALTSIALIFAMSQVNPPLFVILDETDAALDEANSKRYGDMITALSEKSQLILITHNRETMSRAGVLYGVTMGADGISKLLSVKFDEAVAVAK